MQSPRASLINNIPQISRRPTIQLLKSLLMPGSFGQIGLSYFSDSVSRVPVPGTLWSGQSGNNPLIFYGLENGGAFFWEYVFLDTNADAYNLYINDTTFTVRPPPRIFTNRTVNVTYSCDSRLVMEGGDGTSTNLIIMQDSKGDVQRKTIPYAGGTNQTTFITNPWSNDCGPRCCTVHAFEASDVKPWWYECNITVSETHNATLPEHQIGQALAEMAAAGIALQGHIVEASQTITGDQFQYYPSTSIYGFPCEGDVNLMGSNIAQFAIGVIATAADWNPVSSPFHPMEPNPIFHILTNNASSGPKS